MRKLTLMVMTLAALNTHCDRLAVEVTPATAAESSRFAAGAAPGSVEVADFNGDRKPDVAVANEQSGTVTVLLGDGKGGLTAAKGSPFPAGHQPNDIAVGDFNHDAKLDLAFANHEEKHLTVLLGDGRGGFTPAPGSPFAVDVRPHTHGVAAADLNGDGNLDLVTDSWGTDQVTVLFGDGKGGFKTPGMLLSAGKHPYQRVRTADVNGDGRADILTTNLEGDNVTILLADGKGGFKPSAGSPFPCGDSPFFVAVGDLNGDGKPDLAIVNAPSSTSDRQGRDGLTLLLGDGTGGFTKMAGSPFTTSRIPNRLAIGDVNGDGVADVAVTSTDSDNITLFLMNRGGVASSSTIAVGKQPKGIALHDLNGDGKAEIVVANNGDGKVIVIYGR